MVLEMIQRTVPRSLDEQDGKLHECSSCDNKERVYLTSPNGRQSAAIWRCRQLSQKTRSEVVVQPHENCFEHRSLTDYWQQTPIQLIR
jgi:ribosomal protein L37AE/L43A